MEKIAFLLSYVAAVGMVASYLVATFAAARAPEGAAAGDRVLRIVSALIWPLTGRRREGMPPDQAALLNKAVVAFMVCLLVAAASWTAAANLHRIAR
jgi:hypothetical protein